jgi:tRNA(fMet)-specific endonuclease VapC
MLILDTDHLSELNRGSPAGLRFAARLGEANSRAAVTVVTVEETIQGWLKEIHRGKPSARLVASYAQFQQSVQNFSHWLVLPWTNEAADIFDEIRSRKINVGTMDLRIACIVLALGGTLLTRNLVDFQKVAGLKVENWLV